MQFSKRTTLAVSPTCISLELLCDFDPRAGNRGKSPVFIPFSSPPPLDRIVERRFDGRGKGDYYNRWTQAEFSRRKISLEKSRARASILFPFSFASPRSVDLFFGGKRKIYPTRIVRLIPQPPALTCQCFNFSSHTHTPEGSTFFHSLLAFLSLRSAKIFSNVKKIRSIFRIDFFLWGLSVIKQSTECLHS